MCRTHETFCLSPSGPAAGNKGAGGDGKQVLPWFADSAPQIPALQQGADGSGSSTAGSGGGDHRPGTKVSGCGFQSALLWELSWWGSVLGLNLQKRTVLMAEVCILETAGYEEYLELRCNWLPKKLLKQWVHALQ